MGLELQPGQGVIVPSFTFAASAEVMPVMGAIPIFAEVDKTSFNIDPEKLPQALAAGKPQASILLALSALGCLASLPIMPRLAISPVKMACG